MEGIYNIIYRTWERICITTGQPDVQDLLNKT